MQRILYLNSLPNHLYQQVKSGCHLREITPTVQAARAMSAPHQSLEYIAQSIIHQQGLSIASILIAHRAIRTAVGEVIETLDIEGTARRLTPAVKAILRSGINLNELETFNSNRIQQLVNLTRAYYSKLRNNKLLDPAEVLWQAADLQPQRQAILVYGYFHPQMDELTFIDALAGDGSVMLLPYVNSAIFTENQKAIEWLRQRGWQVETNEQTFPNLWQKSFLNNTSIPTNTAAYIYPQLEAEVRGVLTQVKALLHQGVATNEIVLVARNETFYGSTILDIAWEYDLPIRALYAVPLSSTRFGAWVQLLLEVVREKFPFESTAKLLSHPLSGGLSPEIWTQARQLHPNNLLAWQGIGVNLSLLDWPKRDSRADWVQRLQDVFTKFNLRRRAGRWAREIVAFYKLQEALIDLSKPEKESISFDNFTRDILDSLNLLSVPAQPGRGGVELHTPLSLFGAKFKHVFVLGTAEGILPAPVQDDPVIDFYTRKQLIKQGFSLAGAAEAARREAVSFYALLQTATNTLTFSYPQLLGNSPSLPSPYLTQMGIEAIPQTVFAVASMEEARRVYLRRNNLLINDLVLPKAYHAWQVEWRREGSGIYDEYDGFVGLPLDPRKRVFSASQLTALGQCAFKWFANKVLKLAEIEEAETDLSPDLKGLLYHRSLELALAQVLGTTDLGEIGIAHLESAFVQAEQDLTFPSLAAWDSRRSEHIKILNRAMQKPEFWQTGAEILALETQFQADWYGLKVTGRVDRIDRTANGLILLDYKTSSHPPTGIKDESGKANLDIQVSLYIHAAQNNLFPGEAVEEAYYYSLTKAKKFGKRPLTEETLKAIAERVKNHLETGYYPVEPDVDRKACIFCPFDLVCRQGNRLSRKGGAV